MREIKLKTLFWETAIQLDIYLKTYLYAEMNLIELNAYK